MSRLAKQARELAMATGKLPHEVLLSQARGEIQYAERIDEESGEIIRIALYMDVEGMRDAAKGSAPYFAPKLSTIELMKVSDDKELDAIIAELAAEAGFTTGLAGEGQEGGDSGAADAAPRRRRRSYPADD